MKELESQAIMTVGLGYGDEGKGTIVDFLTREYQAHTVVRFNGGSQAGHHVVTPDGLRHTFTQFGSGTFVPKTRTHLSHYVYVDPLNMFKEEAHLREMGIEDAFQRITIDERSVVITPFHRAVNKLRELALGEERHGTCGLGMSEAVADYVEYPDRALLIGDLSAASTIRKLYFLRDLQLTKIKDLRASLPNTEIVQTELNVLEKRGITEYINQLSDIYRYFSYRAKIVDGEYLGKRLQTPGTIIFEGAQGVLLDQKYGFWPHVTRSNTTFENAETLLSEQNYQGQRVRMGIIRTYATRHGAGPFVTEDPELTKLLSDKSNLENPWQGKFRVGYFDLVSTHYALDVIKGVDGIGLTHFDRMGEIPEWRVCDYYLQGGQVTNQISYQEELIKLVKNCTPHYQILPRDKKSYIACLEEELGVPITLISEGPTYQDKYFNKII